MPISTEEAAEALSEIASAERRSSILRGYQYGAPHLLLWGIIWMVGYGLTDVLPAIANTAWLVLDLVGITGSFMLGRATATGVPDSSRYYGIRFMALGVTLFAFISATYFILKPTSAAQFGAFPALLLAALYTVVGIWRGMRWAVAGAVLAVCTVAGFAVFKEHFLLWMAGAGGGALLLAGAWLRRA